MNQKLFVVKKLRSLDQVNVIVRLTDLPVGHLLIWYLHCVAEGETVCLPHANTTVTVKLEQPSFQTYMTLYDFTLHFQHQSATFPDLYDAV